VKNRRIARIAIPAVAAVMAMAPLTAANAAPATLPPDTPAFSFSDCPTLPANYDPNQSQCFNVVVVGGKFQLGKVDKPIEKPIKITYASLWNNTTQRPETVFGKLRAEPMLIEGVFGDPLLTAVYATPEYAGKWETPPGTNFSINTALKVRLQGRVLPVDCHIGSNSDAINLNLITGTTAPPAPNTPITGEKVRVVGTEGPVTVRQGTHVENSFRAPGANGCGLINGGLLDTIINSQAGTPSAAGKNTMIFKEFIGSVAYSKMP